MSWQTALLKRHPQLFGTAEPGHARGYPSVGDGWQLLVEKAIERIHAATASVPPHSITIVQIKEKLGGLRIYADWHALPDDVAANVQEAIELAEARAECTCETCGASGRLHNDDGWLLTRCEQHASGEPAKPGHGDAGLHIRYVVVDGQLHVSRRRQYDRGRDIFVDTPPPAKHAGEK